jgi:hypothetical protein
VEDKNSPDGNQDGYRKERWLVCWQKKPHNSKKKQARHWWLMPVILAMWKLKSGESQFKASLGK